MNKWANKRDQFGIYEFQEDIKKNHLKQIFNLKVIMKVLLILLLILVLVYMVAIGVKFVTKSKAITMYHEEEYEAAIELFEDALKPRLPLLQGFDRDIRFYLADCYLNVGDYGTACYQYNKIKIWSSKKVDGLDNLENIAYGLQLYDWEEYQLALPILLGAYEDGYEDLILYVGSCYGQIGDLENMQKYYDLFLSKNVMNSFMYAQYAAIALDEGRYEEAFSFIEKGKVLEDQSNIKEILFDEIVYYERMKDYNTAFEKASAFIKAYPEDKDGKNEYDLLYTRKTNVE